MKPKSENITQDLSAVSSSFALAEATLPLRSETRHWSAVTPAGSFSWAPLRTHCVESFSTAPEILRAVLTTLFRQPCWALLCIWAAAGSAKAVTSATDRSAIRFPFIFSPGDRTDGDAALPGDARE